jgi:hypothetical protein
MDTPSAVLKLVVKEHFFLAHHTIARYYLISYHKTFTNFFIPSNTNQEKVTQHEYFDN